jgi:methionyl aminopeptidase
MIEILNSTELPRAREAGALVAGILQTLKSRCEVGTNLLDIDQWTRAMITDAGARSCYVDYAPAFGRGPFGHYICTSVNDAVLHGLPHDYPLANGDLLTLDLAVSRGGVVADSAISFIVGDPSSPQSVAMIKATERALSAGIAAARPGARIGDISHAIGAVLSEAGYQINTEFGGHGVGSTMHQDPHVPNTGDPVADTGCAPDFCWHWSRGSWPTPPGSSQMPTAGHCEARRAAGPRTVSTRSPSPTTGPKSSPRRASLPG